MHKTLALPAAIFLFLLISCSSKDKKNPCGGGPGVPCPLIHNIHFRFSILDKSTGQDLFFSTPPSYPVSALKVTWSRGGDGLSEVDTFSSHHDFFMTALEAGLDTFYFQIANTKADTLVYTANTHSASCCEEITVLTDITFNGQMISESLDLSKTDGSTILIFRK